MAQQARVEGARGVSSDGQLGAATDGVDDGVNGEGEQLTGNDHQLVEGHDGATNTLRRGFG